MNMKHYFQQAAFKQSATNANTLPPVSGSEVAFAGRSNSGKSSTINRACSQRALARISKTPGRTQLLNFFVLPDDNFLVDLPGYGYAKVPTPLKMQWQKFIDSYLSTRSTLKGLILVMDIRHPMTEFDTILLNWANYRQLPVHILLNKADKLSRGAASANLHGVQKILLETPKLQASVQLFSAQTGLGLEFLWDQLTIWLEPSWPQCRGVGQVIFDREREQ